MKNYLVVLFVVSCFFNCFGENAQSSNNSPELNETNHLLKFTSLVLSKDTTGNTENPDRKTAPPNIALSPGIIFQKQTFGEINLLIGRYESGMSGNAFGGVRLGAETNFRKEGANIWAPKIGVEFSGMVFCLRATTLYYITDQTRQWRFLPELGISFLGFANLTYGYNFKLSPGTIDGMVNHRVCLSINFNPELMSDIFWF